jgi:hypothetical protein
MPHKKSNSLFQNVVIITKRQNLDLLMTQKRSNQEIFSLRPTSSSVIDKQMYHQSQLYFQTISSIVQIVLHVSAFL